MQWTRRAILGALGASAAWPVLLQLPGCAGAAGGERVGAPVRPPVADIRGALRDLVEKLARDHAEARAVAHLGHRAVAAVDANERRAATASVAAAVFTVSDGAAVYEAATTDLTPAGLRRAAEKLARSRSRSGGKRTGAAATSARTADRPRAAREYAMGAAIKGAIEDAALGRAADIHERSRRFGGSRVVYRAARSAVTDVEVLFAGGGRDLHQRLRRAVSAATFVTRAGSSAIAATVSHAGALGADAVAITDDDLRTAAADLLELFHAGPAPTGSFDVVLDPTVAALLVAGGVMPALTGDTWAAGRSRAVGLVGQTIAAAPVTVVDDPTRAGGFASYAFDDEGEPAKRAVLIDGGVLRGPLTDRASAAALRLHPTGHGRREGPLAPAAPRPTNIALLPGKSSTSALIGSVDRGLMVEGGLSVDVDPSSWRVGIRAARAREIRGGRWTGRRYRDVAVAAYVPALLSRITGLSDAVMWAPWTAAGGAACAVGAPFVRTHADLVGTG